MRIPVSSRNGHSLVALCVAGCVIILVSIQLVESKNSERISRYKSNPSEAQEPGEESTHQRSKTQLVHWQSTQETPIPTHIADLSQSLHRLHVTALTAFESAPNFGYQRMPSVIRESSPPRHIPLLFVELNSWIEGDRKPHSGEPKPTEAWMWLKQMTGISADGFVYHPNKIRWRQHVPDAIDRLTCGYPDPNNRTFDRFADKLSDFPMNLDVWRVASIELIGLWKRQSPLVFEHRLNDMSDNPSKAVQTRPVDRLEADSLARLRSDAQLVASIEERNRSIRLVGAIRASKACLKCHETKVGSLLGAFTYRLERIPHPEKLVGPRIPAQELVFPWIRKMKGRVYVDEQNRAIDVYLSSSELPDDFLKHLKELKQLEVVSLPWAKLKNESLRHLTELPKLQKLSFQNTRISDTGLLYVGQLKELLALDLTRTDVTDAGLAHLKQNVKLQQLDLEGCKITDAGLNHLASIKHLRRLSLTDTKVTAEGVKKLKAALSQCDIDSDHTEIPAVNKKNLGALIGGIAGSIDGSGKSAARKTKQDDY